MKRYYPIKYTWSLDSDFLDSQKMTKFFYDKIQNYYKNCKEIVNINLKKIDKYNSNNITYYIEVSLKLEENEIIKKILIAKSNRTRLLKDDYLLADFFYKSSFDKYYLTVKPLEYCEDYNIFIYEAIKGNYLEEFIYNNNSYDDILWLIKEVAICLQNLHKVLDLPFVPDEFYTSSKKEFIFAKILCTFTEFYPKQVIKVERFLKQVYAYLEHFRTNEFMRCLVHADFGHHNILVTKDKQLGLVDFNVVGFDDPARDIADFMTHFLDGVIEYNYVKGDNYRNLEKHFLRAYNPRLNQSHPGYWRIMSYKVISYLEIASHILRWDKYDLPEKKQNIDDILNKCFSIISDIYNANFINE